MAPREWVRGRRAARGLAAVTLLALAWAGGGCARRAAPEAVWRVAVQAPLAGPRAELGRAVLRGAQSAAEEAAPAFRARGVRLEVAAFDESDPRQGVANAELIAADPTVLGVVGHLDSGVAVAASERYHQAGLALVSVAATAPEFTERGISNVQRLVPPDDVQAAAAARHAAEDRKAASVFIFHDRSLYGQGLADAFRAAVERLSLRVEGYRGIGAGGPLPEVVREVKESRADLVFFGGDETLAAALAVALRRAGVQAPLWGGDSLGAPAFAALCGAAASGACYTSPWPDPAASPAGRAWAARFRERFGSEPHGLAALAYDATRLLLKAAAGAAGAPPGPPDRAAVAAAVRGTSGFTGVSGPIAFDAKGDNLHATAASVRLVCLP